MSPKLLIILGAVVAMVVVAVLMQIFAPAQYIEELELADNEDLLYKEAGIKVEETVKLGRSSQYVRSMLWVTNRRILIGQKPLFGSRGHMLRIQLGIAESDKAVPTGLQGQVRSGRISMDRIRLAGEGEGGYLELRPQGLDGFNSDSVVLKVYCADPEQILSRLGGVRGLSQPAQ